MLKTFSNELIGSKQVDLLGRAGPGGQFPRFTLRSLRATSF